MKKIFLPLFVIFITSNIFSQTENTTISEKDNLTLIKGTYYFTQSLPESFSPLLLNDDTKTSINKGNKITVLYEYEDSIYFKYWIFTNNNDLKTKYNEDKIFKMSKREFKQLTSPLYRRYKGASVGAYTIPFRLRDIGGDNFDFESSLSLQANMVFGFGSRKSQFSWFDASFGIGVTGVNLSSKNSLVTEDRTASAFTLSLGTVFKPTRYANIGVFMGWDFLGQKDKEVEWKHNGKTWIGLGINVSFNEIKTKKAAKDPNE